MISYRGTSAELLCGRPSDPTLVMMSIAGQAMLCAAIDKKTGVRRAGISTVADGATLAALRHRPLSQVRAIEV